MEGMGKFGRFFVQMVCRRGVVGTVETHMNTIDENSGRGCNIKIDVEGLWISV
jgi:hypothetical protein